MDKKTGSLALIPPKPTLSMVLLLTSSSLLVNGFSFAKSALSEIDSKSQHEHSLVIYGAAYLSEMKPVLEGFEQKYPSLKVDYTAMSSNVLDAYIRENTLPQPDITISSVMDLQIRLVNDGYARPHKVNLPGYNAQSGIIPQWSQWRDELFGFSYEPAVIVFNQSFLEGKQTPSNRVELLSFIRRHSDELKGKIGLFDIRHVGIGYLLWSFERAQTTNYGQFLELFNLHQARTFGSSASMLKALNEGEIAMAYNIMGSYANSWQAKHQDVVIVAAEDYTPVVIRTAFINKTTTRAEQAEKFIDYLFSYSGQQRMAEETNMPPVRSDIKSHKSAKSLRQDYAERLKPLPLDVSLLIFSDQSKRDIVITEWESALKTYD